MATIVLTGGGTAGHCTPHIALLPYLKKDFDKIYYIGSENGIEKDIILNENIPYYSVPCAKLNRSITLKNFNIPFKMLSGIIKAGKILTELKPDVIFSKGGYVSLPTVIAAKKRNIPVIAHESDYTIGLANKISSKFCKKILTSFPETAKSINNGEYVGSPIRKNIFSTTKKDALANFGFNGNKPVLLVTGGSQGSTAINNAVRDALDELLPKFDIIHLCGKNNLYQNKTPKGYFQAEFINKMEHAFNAASVCVSRAGANSVFEIMSLKLPCVLIPLPKDASRGDQILNAKYFERLGLASVLPQESLTAKSLTHYVNAAYANRFNVSRSFDKSPINDASRQISRILADYIK